MHTDIPLKRLTLLRAQDLLPLLDVGDATVLSVETEELPATATRLDNILRLRSPFGQTFLHLIEWQGYNDPAVLWRVAGYLAWLGQREPNTTIIGTLVYLTPAADVSNTITQLVDNQPILSWSIPCVRLWQHDAQAAIVSNHLGLAVLSPLMRNATAPLVEQAIERVLAEAPLPQQNDLLSILGVFAEPIMKTERFVRLVTKERLMATGLISYLFREQFEELEQKIARLEQEKAILEQRERQAVPKLGSQLSREQFEELEQKIARLEQEKAAREQAEHTLHQTLIDVLAARFPQASVKLVQQFQRINDPATIQRLITAVAVAPDLADVERLVADG